MKLNTLGKTILLDRYAVKDPNRNNISVGDQVIYVANKETGGRNVGLVADINYDIEELGFEREVGHNNVLAICPMDEETGEFSESASVYRNALEVDKPLETTPEEIRDRVARGIAAAENTEELRNEWTENFKWLMNDWKFIPGGRILAAAGTTQQLTYYNCYVIPSPEDSRAGIFKTAQLMAEIMSRGGGVGVNLSTLRPRRAYVAGVNGRSSGAVSWGGMLSYVTGLIEQGGSRRGALMLILEDWHPDILEFITSKTTAGKITNANISVAISDEFMQAVENDSEWVLSFPDTSHPEYKNYSTVWENDYNQWRNNELPIVEYKRLPARQLWQQITESAWASAEPGIWFIDRANDESNTRYHNNLIATNPCGEIALSEFGVCNLGAINLSQFYNKRTNNIDEEALEKAISYAVRFLDNVIDTTPYFLEKNRIVQMNERRIGLGTMGLAELLIKMKIRYGSEESIAFIEGLYDIIRNTAYLTSAELAWEKCAYPAFELDLHQHSGFMKRLLHTLRNRPECDGTGKTIYTNAVHFLNTYEEYGMRNCALLTQAPTGTTGTMVDTSTGIEPFFAFEYHRQGHLGKWLVEVPIAKQWREANPGEDLPEHFVTAMDLLPEEHIIVQATVQKFIDNAISKTCNVPADYTVAQVAELYELMYDLGCKGGTVYRDQSRDEQVLTLKDDCMTGTCEL